MDLNSISFPHGTKNVLFGPACVIFLSKVDEAGEGEHGHRDQHEQQPQLLVGLLQGRQQRLEPGEVSDELENPQDPHHADEADYLAGLADDLEILQPGEDEREIEGDDGEKIDKVHRAFHKLHLFGAADESDEILDGEEDDAQKEG